MILQVHNLIFQAAFSSSTAGLSARRKAGRNTRLLARTFEKATERSNSMAVGNRELKTFELIQISP